MADFGSEDPAGDNATLSSDAVQEEVSLFAHNRLANEEWNAAKADALTDDLVSGVLKQLADLRKPFKYVVNCTLMQKTGAPLSSGFASVWDNAKDGMVHVPCENSTMHCLITVYFLKID